MFQETIPRFCHRNQVFFKKRSTLRTRGSQRKIPTGNYQKPNKYDVNEGIPRHLHVYRDKC